jgi:ribonuclease HI
MGMECSTNCRGEGGKRNAYRILVGKPEKKKETSRKTKTWVSECHQSLMQLAKLNRVQLIWMPGHEGIHGNETADQLAKLASERLLTGPEPAYGISMVVAKKAVRD